MWHVSVRLKLWMIRKQPRGGESRRHYKSLVADIWGDLCVKLVLPIYSLFSQTIVLPCQEYGQHCPQNKLSLQLNSWPSCVVLCGCEMVKFPWSAHFLAMHCTCNATQLVFGCFVLQMNQFLYEGVAGFERNGDFVFGEDPSRFLRHCWHISSLFDAVLFFQIS